MSAAGGHGFKRIQVVPEAKALVEIVLSRTQRKTPTVVHPQFKISRIRKFYMRKIKYTQTTIDEKLAHILDEFPRLDEIHPFYADLVNVLYDRDHYKLALGQINTARNLIDNLGKDYVRLLKYGDSLYRCKQLKRSGMGRMCTLLKRLGPSMAYLEQVRQHLARLPNIDPSARTLIMCGFPNVGKSSFMNKVTRANVEVHNYPFTTKSLYVGHLDYRYLRWQVIDTPGILDHALEDRNTIEMQAITALAHLRAAILFFIDISETCGHSVAEQVALFKNVSPLFSGKPLVVVLNKIDIQPMDQLGAAAREALDSLGANVLKLPMSAVSEEGIAQVTNAACDHLLEMRDQERLRGAKGADILSRIHVAFPAPRDGRARPAFVPDSVVHQREAVAEGSVVLSKRKTLRDYEMEAGGAGVFQTDHASMYMLKNPEWRYDVMPEIVDGHNVADFIDADIMERLEALEREEEARAANDEYASLDDSSELDSDTKDAVREVRRQKQLLRDRHQRERSKSRSSLPRSARPRDLDDLRKHLAETGVDADGMAAAVSAPRVAVHRGRSRTRRDGSDGSDADSDADAMDAEGSGARKLNRSESRARERSRSRSRSASVSRSHSHVPEDNVPVEIRKKAEKAMKRAQKTLNVRQHRQGESDRTIVSLKPKHLFSGKRGMKADRR